MMLFIKIEWLKFTVIFAPFPACHFLFELRQENKTFTEAW